MFKAMPWRDDFLYKINKMKKKILTFFVVVLNENAYEIEIIMLTYMHAIQPYLFVFIISYKKTQIYVYKIEIIGQPFCLLSCLKIKIKN